MQSRRYPGIEDTPEGFGAHPRLVQTKRRAYRQAIRTGTSFLKLFQETTVPLKKFFDPRHPSVYVIPRDRLLRVIDSFGDVIGMMEVNLPFSSTNFHPNQEDRWAFQAMQTEPFFLLGDKPQLGFLVPPWRESKPEYRVSFCMPLYPHTRWIHSLIAAMLAEVILARNGFSKQERVAIVLAVSHHDAALPIGGDSIKRIDPLNLNEERNFPWVIKHFGLDKKWGKKFNFDLSEAAAWVRNEGVFGQLLDYVDKMSYVALDCYHVGCSFDGQVRSFCRQHPLFMDVWQDLCFTQDKKRLGFTNAERLYDFLLARALEHRELLLNPYGRTLDFYLTKLVEPLYRSGEITKEQLLTWNRHYFETALSAHYPEEIYRPTILTPELFHWHRFTTRQEMKKFRSSMADEPYHYEFIPGFKLGLDWPVFIDSALTETVPLITLLQPSQIKLIEEIKSSVSGHYIYWHAPTP